MPAFCKSARSPSHRPLVSSRRESRAEPAASDRDRFQKYSCAPTEPACSLCLSSPKPASLPHSSARAGAPAVHGPGVPGHGPPSDVPAWGPLHGDSHGEHHVEVVRPKCPRVGLRYRLQSSASQVPCANAVHAVDEELDCRLEHSLERRSRSMPPIRLSCRSPLAAAGKPQPGL